MMEWHEIVRDMKVKQPRKHRPVAYFHGCPVYLSNTQAEPLDDLVNAGRLDALLTLACEAKRNWLDYALNICWTQRKPEYIWRCQVGWQRSHLSGLRVVRHDLFGVHMFVVPDGGVRFYISHEQVLLGDGVVLYD